MAQPSRPPSSPTSTTGIVVSGFVEPFDTWADMSQLAAQEKVNGSTTVAYFCNVLADAPPPARGEARRSGSTDAEGAGAGPGAAVPHP